MPIYAYRCSNCGHAQDVLQRMSDPVLSVCPACGQPTYVKQVTAAGFQLKGSGWYVTDFRGDRKTGQAAEADKTDATNGDAAGASANKPVEKGADTPAAGSDAKAEAKKGDSAKKAEAVPAPAPAAASPTPAPAAPTPSGKTGS